MASRAAALKRDPGAGGGREPPLPSLPPWDLKLHKQRPRSMTPYSPLSLLCGSWSSTRGTTQAAPPCRAAGTWLSLPHMEKSDFGLVVFQSMFGMDRKFEFNIFIKIGSIEQSWSVIKWNSLYFKCTSRGAKSSHHAAHPTALPSYIPEPLAEPLGPVGKTCAARAGGRDWEDPGVMGTLKC